MPTRDDVRIVQGDDSPLNLTVTHDDEPYPLTGKRIELQVRTSSLDTAPEVFQLSTEGMSPRITITDAANGLAEVDLTDLAEDQVHYWYEAWVADVSDENLDRRTFTYGLWIVSTPGVGSSATLGSPCDPWPVDLTGCTGLPEDLDPNEVERWSAVASQILWGLSGRRWGPCSVTVRPCRKTCLDGYLSGPLVTSYGSVGWIPYTANGVWRNASVCGCGGSCACGELCEVRLQTPVYAITSVTIDGITLDPAAYRVDAPGNLVRQDGECWPSCQDLGAPDGAEGTFVVEYQVGLQLDDAAIAAVSAYTCELIKAAHPECDCQLPQRVTQISRQGVTMQLIDPQDFLENGLTGVTLTDMWLRTVNPNRLTGPGRVMSPDARGVRTRLL